MLHSKVKKLNWLLNLLASLQSVGLQVHTDYENGAQVHQLIITVCIFLIGTFWFPQSRGRSVIVFSACKVKTRKITFVFILFGEYCCAARSTKFDLRAVQVCQKFVISNIHFNSHRLKCAVHHATFLLSSEFQGFFPEFICILLSFSLHGSKFCILATKLSTFAFFDREHICRKSLFVVIDRFVLDQNHPSPFFPFSFFTEYAPALSVFSQYAVCRNDLSKW